MLAIHRKFGILIEALLILFLSMVAGTVVNALLRQGIPLMNVEAEGLTGMTMQEALRLHERGAVFLDAREKGPYENAHIPGALNIPPGMFIDEIRNRLRDVEKDETIVAYCSSDTCLLAEQLAQNLRVMGYTDVRVFKPGFTVWRLENGPVEEGS
jgi:rhodanese-related sulfurtransferase